MKKNQVLYKTYINHCGCKCYEKLIVKRVYKNRIFVDMIHFNANVENGNVLIKMQDVEFCSEYLNNLQDITGVEFLKVLNAFIVNL